MATLKLRVRDAYSHGPRGLHYAAGQVIVVDETLGAWLRADAPDNFAPFVERVIEPVKTEALDEPPADKQVKRAPRKKGL